ncbi:MULTISPECIES: Maf family protein [Isoptericola]|uniref:Maf family protein n=1 Tax=Isoptericola TaxID=254250 RepID=UPI001FB00954|nr:MULTISPECIES: nucleoside triphosphate pyrophosphatase [Isoptericola]
MPHSPVQLVLASRSPARLATLRSAGVEPAVRVSHVDEDAVLAAARERYPDLPPSDAVLVLAQAKAEEVARVLDGDHDAPGALVLGCDSMLEIDGEIVGKPGTAEVARERWRSMRGRSGVLHSGHWVVDCRSHDDGGTGATLGATSSTTVHFADLDDAEIDAYVATGEPLEVAGAFTIDGLGGPYVERLEGDPHGVVGVSLPLLRELLAEIDVPFRHLRDHRPPQDHQQQV